MDGAAICALDTLRPRPQPVPWLRGIVVLRDEWMSEHLSRVHYYKMRIDQTVTQHASFVVTQLFQLAISRFDTRSNPKNFATENEYHNRTVTALQY
jgi:hypothetical protein